MSNKFGVSHSNNGEVIEIIIRDYSGAKIDSFRFNVSDKTKANMVFKTLEDKYGLKIGKKSKDKDLDWIADFP